MALSLDVWILLLRLALVLVIYAFLYQVAAAIYRSIQLEGSSGQPRPETPRGRETIVPAPPMPRPQPRVGALVVVDPGGADLLPGTTFTVDGPLRIGRAAANAVVLNDTFVSSEHAVVDASDGQLVVQDLGSTNGTLLNGQAVHRPAPLKPGDVIQIGGVRLMVQK